MNTERDQQTVIRALLRYPVISAAIVIVVTALALFVVRSRPVSLVAEAAIVLSDPAANSIVDAQPNQSSDRRVANQLVVISSESVADRAADIVSAAGYDVDAETIREETLFESVRDTDVITVTFASEDIDQSRTVVQAIVDAYLDLIRDQRLAESEEIISRLLSAREVIAEDLAEIRQQIQALRDERGFDVQTGLVLDRLSQVQAQINETTDPVALETLQERRAELRNQLDGLILATEVESEQGDLEQLLTAEADLEARLTEIATRRSTVEIEAETASSGVSNVSVTTEPVVEGAGTLFTAAAGLILGLALAAAVAYFLSSRDERFADRSEPGRVLGFPFLADVPGFAAGGANTELPVRDSPRSPVAEAFRFAAASLQVQRNRLDASSIMMVSANVGDGKSTVLANTAMAAARMGQRVLVVDADFGNQAVSRLLLGDDATVATGLTEVVGGAATLADVVRPIEVSAGKTIDVIGRGLLPAVAPDFFSDPNVADEIRRFSRFYDVVFIDSPPLLQVAYASAIAQLADGLVVILSHDSPTATAIELANRIGFMDANVIGYIYNRAPVRAEMLESGGSMLDVLGDLGFTDEVERRRRAP